jgi:hypothetical protein
MRPLQGVRPAGTAATDVPDPGDDPDGGAHTVDGTADAGTVQAVHDHVRRRRRHGVRLTGVSDRYVVAYVGGHRPHVVKNADTHRIVGRSRTREVAEASARARYAEIGKKKRRR